MEQKALNMPDQQVTLIITEKPSAAKQIAQALIALTETDVNIKSRYNQTFYQIENVDKKIIICSAIGHLFQVTEKNPQGRHRYPVWQITWKPIYTTQKKMKSQERTAKLIQELSLEATQYINACDYDREGSLIGYMILKYLCNNAYKSSYRMKFSTLTSKEIIQSYHEAKFTPDDSLALAGMCRHEIDWLYGVNLSRALTQTVMNHSGIYATLSIGRVQGPTLNFIAQREKQILTHVPTPFWNIQAIFNIQGQQVEANYIQQKINTQQEANKIVKECQQRKGTVTDITIKKVTISPPYPFDLTTLQTESYRHFGLSPSKTLSIAENLYLQTLISYPRTSSQKLPSVININTILKSLKHQIRYHKEIQTLQDENPKLIPHEGPKKDSAHPSIYPTGTPIPHSLSQKDLNLYDLITRRFLATLANPQLKEIKRITLQIQDHIFYINGSATLKSGWTKYYKPYFKQLDQELPQIIKGDKYLLQHIEAIKKMTSPPPRYNPSSLLRLMEKQDIGTKATRANIIDTLFKRQYIKAQRIEATYLGLHLIDILTGYCPRIIDVQLTRDMEKQMQGIEENQKKREEILIDAKNDLKPILALIKESEKNLGKDLSQLIKENYEKEKNLFSKCPKCGSILRVVKNKKTNKRFIGCTAKRELNCDFALPLPQKGRLTLLSKTCLKCNFQLISVRINKRKPLVACPYCYINPQDA